MASGVRAVMVVAALAACGRLGFDRLDDGGAQGAGDAAAPACERLMNCGPQGNAPCCESVLVPGGMFLRGYDVAADVAYTDMTHPATVSSFRLDTYEVTVGRFRQFVEAGMGTQTNPPAAGAGAHAMIANSGWDPSWNGELAADTAALRAALVCNAAFTTWTDATAGRENVPITCITWYEAMAFCAWDGGFLPTEAEWNYAASGGAMHRAYPWSNPPATASIGCTEANFGGASWPSTACATAGQTVVGSTSPVGDGMWGHTDLAGNAWEWGLDWFAPNAPMPCDDCANLTPATTRIVRGGSFNDPASMQRSARRGNGTEPFIRF